MGRKIKLEEFKPLKSVKYHTERHHTCTNSQICKLFFSPCAECEGCKYYKFRDVDVADNPIRYDINWF